MFFVIVLKFTSLRKEANQAIEEEEEEERVQVRVLCSRQPKINKEQSCYDEISKEFKLILKLLSN